MPARAGSRPARPPVSDRVQELFDDFVDPVLRLADEWIAEERYPEELVVLVCARIDALANLSLYRRTQRQAFADFVTEYSGRRRELQQISVPNLYRYLALQYYTLIGTIPDAGRLHLVDSSSLPFVRFLADSSLPLTHSDLSRFLEWFSRVVQRRYRTTATQSRSKPSLDSLKSLHKFLAESGSSHRGGKYSDAISRMKPLLEDFSVAAMLYRDFRSASIHQIDFEVDDRFFKETGMYFTTVWWAPDETGYLDLQFSAMWMAQLLRHVAANYLSRLAATGKLPLGIWTEVCWFDETEYLDDGNLDVGRAISFSLGR